MLWRNWPVFGMAAIAAYVVYAAYGQGVAHGKTEVTAQWQQSQLAYDEAVRKREDAYQAERAAAATKRTEELKDATATIARVRADSERLRTALRDAIGRIPAENGRTAGGAGSTGNVLALVCSRAGEVAAELAAYADRERIARRECQRTWPR